MGEINVNYISAPSDINQCALASDEVHSWTVLKTKNRVKIRRLSHLDFFWFSPTILFDKLFYQYRYFKRMQYW